MGYLPPSIFSSKAAVRQPVPIAFRREQEQILCKIIPGFLHCLLRLPSLPVHRHTRTLQPRLPPW